MSILMVNQLNFKDTKIMILELILVTVIASHPTIHDRNNRNVCPNEDNRFVFGQKPIKGCIPWWQHPVYKRDNSYPRLVDVCKKPGHANATQNQRLVAIIRQNRQPCPFR